MTAMPDAGARRGVIVLWIAILASFVAFLDGSIVNVGLPAISADLGGAIATQQWVVDAYLLTLGSLILLAGSLSDAFGRVRVLRWGLVIFGVASLACALAPEAGFLIGARAVQGVGAALLVPSSLALITATFDGPERSRAIGRWTGWTGVAFVIGPPLGGVLVDTVGWRAIFLINVLPIAVTLVLLARLGRLGAEVRPVTRPRIDVIGAVLASLGLAGPVFALIEHGRLGWTDPLVLVPLVGGLACFAGFLWWQTRAPHPLMPLSLFRVRNFAYGNLTTAAVYAAIALGQFLIAVYLQEVAGFSATAAGLATIPLSILSITLSSFFGTLAGRHGPRLFMTIGPLTMAAGFLLMLTVAEPLAFWTQVLPGILLFGLGLAITVAPLTSAILGSIDTARSGIASAVNNAVARVAGLVSIAFAGTIIGGALDTDAFHRVVLVTAVLFIVGGVVAFIGIRTPVAAVPVERDRAVECSDRAVPGAGQGAVPAAEPGTAAS